MLGLKIPAEGGEGMEGGEGSGLVIRATFVLAFWGIDGRSILRRGTAHCRQVSALVK